MNYIIWNEKNSKDISGLLITELPSITKPKMKTKITQIDGRDGDIIEELGYESYSKSVKIGLYGSFNIDEVIKYFTGNGNVTFSNEPNKYYRASIINKINYERLLRFKTAIVEFYVQPYKYLKDEEYQSINAESSMIENKGLEESKPIIHLTGTGTISLKINGQIYFTYEFPENENEVYIDCDKHEAYLNGSLRNRNMNGEFPMLKSGQNSIEWLGSITDIKILPRSRWL